MRKMQNWADIFRELRNGRGVSQQKMADDLGIPQRTWANYESGRSKPTLDIAAVLAEKGYEVPGLTPDFYNFNTSILILQLKAQPTEGHKVPLLRQKVSCGPGVDWETDDNVEEYIDVFSILPRLTTGRMYAFKAKGSSMLGAGIRSGDYLIFDAELDFIPKDDVYVFMLDGEVYCKRIEFDRLANKMKIYSVRVADLEKAELVRTLDTTESSYGDRFRIFGRVRCLLRPNRGDD
jgi:transcriptional regulator with XRE-family HTH domain